MTDKDQDVSKLPWLGRESRAANFSSIVTSLSKAHVISIEAGFGYGKTIFAKKWTGQLRDQEETVITFDAWKADHTDDPLMAFAGKLLDHLPPPPEGSSAEEIKGSKVYKALGNITKIACIAGGKLAAGTYGADAVADYLEAADNTDEKAVIEAVVKAAGGEASKQFVNLLATQFIREKIREKDLRKQLKALREQLDESNKGRIIIIIDELDRCRPDFAISMLEAIKHLFDVEGYIFVLMINPEQIERTAGRLFGKIEGGEPYFAKFVDLRLELGLPAYDELTKLLFEPLDDKFTPLTESPDFRFPKAAEWMSKFAEILAVTPRQIDSAMRHTEIAMMLAQDKPVDPVYLFCAFLLKTSPGKEGEASELINEHIPWVSFGVEIGDRIDKALEKTNKLYEPGKRDVFGSEIYDIYVNLEQDGLQLIGKNPEFGFHRNVLNEKYELLKNARETAKVYHEFLPSLVNTSVEIQAS